MQNVSCPSCGASVIFKSHASVMAVCEYCKTTVLKDADAVKDMGRMSAVLEDYSPLQIGTAGQYGKVAFTVIGRIQLRYAEGIWNEWYVYFDDGRPAWLSDASGQYTLTFEKQDERALPAFDELQPGHAYPILGQNFIASDIRSAECTGGEGELPYRVGAGWQAKVADFRRDKSFLTLDYSESERPAIYAGNSVTLEQLQCQLLRDDDTVRDSAGKIRQKVDALACPSCGSGVRFVPGVTREIICPSCRSQVDTTTRVAIVLEAGHRMAAASTTLELGASAKIGNASHEIIGVMTRSDDEGESWTEYLMHNPRGGFTWLIETDEGWYRTKVLDEWPEWSGGDSARLGAQTFSKRYDYTATVKFAAGAFNWRVNAGDTVRVVEFENGKNQLAAELSNHELTWSLSSPVPSDQIRAWFGTAVKAEKLSPKTPLLTIAKYFLYGMLIFNAVPLLFSFSGTWKFFLFSAAAIYVPALILQAMDDETS
ncbi:DUF4178 domain-containing protein [Noviherbaspirillum saxi]|uniref:DUF4178 domain-containing protein n=1 Tax=Noviherbaspirillum saxi TaxID=2320863 RepID=A0A3A3FMT7_9BURK|nr:DUF4178 domain-containing protein [Noviherbaspirillum saxi]RJF97316.1 DUF4178 domain-containing protein [Noviherbaspirillum saxi]